MPFLRTSGGYVNFTGQWAPTLTSHDPNPPITLETAAAAGNIQPQFVDSTVSVYAPRIRLALKLAQKPSEAALHAPSIRLSLKPASHASGATVYAPRLSVTFKPAAHANPGAAHAPSIRFSLKPAAYTNIAVVYAPTRSASAYVVAPPLLASTNNFHAPRLRLGVTPSHHANANALYGPRLVRTLKPSPYTNASAYYNARITLRLTPVRVTAVNQFYGPNTPVPRTVQAQAFLSSNVFHAPSLFRPDVQPVVQPAAPTSGAGWWTDGSRIAKKRKPKHWVLPKAADIPDLKGSWDLVVVTPELDRRLRDRQSKWQAHLKKLRRDQEAARTASRMVDRLVEDEIVRIVVKIASED
jgi:hypothetical protein